MWPGRVEVLWCKRCVLAVAGGEECKIIWM